jgi:hypothetical protein
MKRFGTMKHADHGVGKMTAKPHGVGKMHASEDDNKKSMKASQDLAELFKGKGIKGSS